MAQHIRIKFNFQLTNRISVDIVNLPKKLRMIYDRSSKHAY